VRETLAKSLCELVTSDTRPVAVAVDGKFWSAKSPFLKMWAAQLCVLPFEDAREEKVVVTEFNV